MTNEPTKKVFCTTANAVFGTTESATITVAFLQASDLPSISSGGPGLPKDGQDAVVGGLIDEHSFVHPKSDPVIEAVSEEPLPVLSNVKRMLIEMGRVMDCPINGWSTVVEGEARFVIVVCRYGIVKIVPFALAKEADDGNELAIAAIVGDVEALLHEAAKIESGVARGSLATANRLEGKVAS